MNKQALRTVGPSCAFNLKPGLVPIATENARSNAAWRRWPTPSFYPYGTTYKEREFCIRALWPA